MFGIFGFLTLAALPRANITLASNLVWKDMYISVVEKPLFRVQKCCLFIIHIVESFSYLIMAQCFFFWVWFNYWWCSLFLKYIILPGMFFRIYDFGSRSIAHQFNFHNLPVHKPYLSLLYIHMQSRFIPQLLITKWVLLTNRFLKLVIYMDVIFNKALHRGVRTANSFYSMIFKFLHNFWPLVFIASPVLDALS